MENNTKSLKIRVGRTFSSFAEVEITITELENKTFCKFFKRDSRKIEAKRWRLDCEAKPELVYSYLKYNCMRSGKKSGAKKFTFRNDCPVHVSFKITKDGKNLRITSCDLKHNHETSKVTFDLLCQDRALRDSAKASTEMASDLSLPKLPPQQNLDAAGIIRVHDLNRTLNREQEISLYYTIEHLKDLYCADVELLMDPTGMTFLGMFFQSPSMRHTMAHFPEFLAIDGTYRLFERSMLMFFFLVEDSNCQAMIVGIGILATEDEKSLEWLIDVFKFKNPSFTQVRSVMIDKNIKSRDAVMQKFSGLNSFLCIFHVLKSFSQMMTFSKLEITPLERNNCLDIFQQLLYDTSDEKFSSHLKKFESTAPQQVVDYYYLNWHSIKHEWHFGEGNQSGNFSNSINNRIEHLNRKIKSAIKSESTFQEVLKNLFHIISSLENGGNQVSILNTMKVTTMYPEKSTEFKYFNVLTMASAKLVAKQLEMSQNITLYLSQNDGNCSFSDTTEAQNNINLTSCYCDFNTTMQLPCKHIFAIRKVLEMPLFDEELFHVRWKKQYYLSCREKLAGCSVDDVDIARRGQENSVTVEQSLYPNIDVSSGIVAIMRVPNI